MQPVPPGVRMVECGAKLESASLFPAQVSLHGAYNINVWLHYFPPLTIQVAQFLTLKFASSPSLVIFCLPQLLMPSLHYLRLFSLVVSGFESIFEPLCSTNFPKHYKNFPTQSPTSETSRKQSPLVSNRNGFLEHRSFIIFHRF